MSAAKTPELRPVIIEQLLAGKSHLRIHSDTGAGIGMIAQISVELGLAGKNRRGALPDEKRAEVERSLRMGRNLIDTAKVTRVGRRTVKAIADAMIARGDLAPFRQRKRTQEAAE